MCVETMCVSKGQRWIEAGCSKEVDPVKELVCRSRLHTDLICFRFRFSFDLDIEYNIWDLVEIFWDFIVLGFGLGSKLT